MTEFTNAVAASRTPAEVLEHLNRIITQLLPLRIAVMGAAYIPARRDWRRAQLGREVFLHPSFPVGWWNEYSEMIKRENDPQVTMARSALIGTTWTERRRILQPIGVDLWSLELANKHGIGDVLGCPVGGRWLISYWSNKPLPSPNVLTEPYRMICQSLATYAARRLDQLVENMPQYHAPRITARELAVIRMVSFGRTTDEIASLLGLGSETIRSHLKNLQAKLGVNNRAHAVAEALRQHLIS